MNYEGPVTGDDWQLYTFTKKCGSAARRLTAALKRTIKKVEGMSMGEINKVGGLSSAVYMAMDEILYPVMEELADYGAADSEPNYVAVYYLRKHFKIN